MVISLLLVLALQADKSSATQQREKEAEALFDQSKTEFREAGRAKTEKEKDAQLKVALGTVQKIIREYKDTSLYGRAQYNAGILLCDYLGDYKAAITTFETLIASGVNDRDSTGRLMAPFRNYRYNAWRMISICREKLKTPALAVDACLQMKKAYVVHCPTCLARMKIELSKRMVTVCFGFGGLDKVFIEKRMEKATTADGLLLNLADDAVATGKKDVAKLILEGIVKDLPKSKGAAAAAKLLEERQ